MPIFVFFFIGTECPGLQMSTVMDYAGRYLIAHQEGTLRARQASPSVQSQFQIIRSGDAYIADDRVTFRNVLGKYLMANKDLTLNWNADRADQWETFRMEQHDDKVAFKTYHNNYLSVTEHGDFISNPIRDEKAMFGIINFCKKGKFKHLMYYFKHF